MGVSAVSNTKRKSERKPRQDAPGDKQKVEIDPRERHDPLTPPTTPDGNPSRTPNPLSEPDVEIKDPPPEDGTPTPVETPPEDR